MKDIKEGEEIKSIHITEKERYSIEANINIRNIIHRVIEENEKKGYIKGYFNWSDVFGRNEEGYFYKLARMIPPDDFFKIKLLSDDMLPTVENYVNSYFIKKINTLEKELENIGSTDLSGLEWLDIKQVLTNDYPKIEDINIINDNIGNIQNKLKKELIDRELRDNRSNHQGCILKIKEYNNKILKFN